MYFLKIYFYLYVGVFVICACLCEYMPRVFRNTQRPEGGFGATGAAAQAAVSPQPGFWDPDLHPLEKQQTLLPSELSLWPQCGTFHCFVTNAKMNA